MLQDDPLRTLKYDSDLRMAQQNSTEPMVHETRWNITEQSSTTTTTSNRIALPIATVQSSSESLNLGSRTYLPRSGYDVLDDMPSLHIEQTFELNDNLSSISSENRYIVRSPLGEALFAASESSTERHRMIWGASRPFQMHLLDKTHQEALTLRRKGALGVYFCQQRYLEVWSPPGDLIGVVLEDSTLLNSEFTVRMGNGDIAFKIRGSTNQAISCCCCIPNEGHYDIYGFDNETVFGSITRKWSSDISQYTMNIYFTDINMNVKSKALLLGAGFLLEYLCFQSRF